MDKREKRGWRKQGERSGREEAGTEERVKDSRDKRGKQGGGERDRVRRLHFQDVHVLQQSTSIHTNTRSLVTSQLEASERVTHALEGACRIDTATSSVTAINTHSTFINVWSELKKEKNKSGTLNFDS